MGIGLLRQHGVEALALAVATALTQAMALVVAAAAALAQAMVLARLAVATVAEQGRVQQTMVLEIGILPMQQPQRPIL